MLQLIYMVTKGFQINCNLTKTQLVQLIAFHTSEQHFLLLQPATKYKYGQRFKVNCAYRFYIHGNVKPDTQI